MTGSTARSIVICLCSRLTSGQSGLIDRGSVRAFVAGSLSSDGLDDEVNRSLAIVAGSLLVQAYRIR